MATLQSNGNRRAGHISAQLMELGPWFHNLHLPGGVQTAPDHPLGDFPAFKWKQLSPALPQDLSGWRVLDIGCNAGFYSFKLASRGAEVCGVDVDPHYLRQAQWAAEQFGLSEQIKFRQMQVYDLARSPVTYDLVLFMGVFYHLRYPLLALDIVAERTEKMLVFQSLSMPGDEVSEQPENIDLDERERLRELGWPKMAYIRRKLQDDPTNWWVPNRACVESMLNDVGFEISARPGDELYICQRSPELTRASLRNPDELSAAIGHRHRRVLRDKSKLN